jgi:hypothetical protein
MKINNPLFIFDIDGTLIYDGTAHLPSANQKNLFSLNSSGVKIALATGRSHTAVMPTLLALEFSLPVITFNGAQTNLWHHQENRLESFSHLPLSSFQSEQILHLFSEFSKDLTLFLYDKNQLSYTGNKQLLAEYQKRTGLIAQLKNIEDTKSIQTTKILISSHPKDKSTLLNFTAKLKNSNIECEQTHSQSHYLEINQCGVSKAGAIKKLMERFNSDCLIVFGDSYNDQSMFEIANYGVAVGNTPEIIKNLSHFQVEASPTGIKQAIIWVQNQLNIRQTEKLHHT